MCDIKIDLEVLEKLWNGDLFPAEQCHSKDKEYRKLLCGLDEIHTQLLERIDENSQAGELLERYEQQASLVVERDHLEAFKMGFALAVSMVAETLSEDK